MRVRTGGLSCWRAAAPLVASPPRNSGPDVPVRAIPFDNIASTN
ncbi:hypothetical protein [uncultured Sphingomonas sp.]|nr:hypothetical protein [uncultured Sphingomonas sp.]